MIFVHVVIYNSKFIAAENFEKFPFLVNFSNAYLATLYFLGIPMGWWEVLWDVDFKMSVVYRDFSDFIINYIKLLIFCASISKPAKFRHLCGVSVIVLVIFGEWSMLFRPSNEPIKKGLWRYDLRGIFECLWLTMLIKYILCHETGKCLHY